MVKSHPARGAWIEIVLAAQRQAPAGRTPQGVRGLKSRRPCGRRSGNTSHPARGAWIEITVTITKNAELSVAPRKGCVD